MEMVVAEELFAGGGEMGALMRSLDWSQTLLGPVSEWAQSLKTALSIILTSRYPMFIWWGAEYANLYNDAYRPILGASKHPQFLGQSAKDCWADVWDVVRPLADSVLTTGQPTWSEDLLLLMDRNGYLEETYFTFSYSPVRDESGGVGGVFCAVTETTGRMIGERRLRTLRELATKTAEAKTVEEACHIATTTLSINPHDIPFALFYRVELDGKQAHLVGTTGIEAGTVASPQQVDLFQENDHWNLARVNRTGQAEFVSDLPTRFGVLPKGAWSDAPTQALVIPIAQSGKAQRRGLLVFGISPRREFDDDYQGFFELIASNVATAIANADAVEEALRWLPEEDGEAGGARGAEEAGEAGGEELHGELREMVHKDTLAANSSPTSLAPPASCARILLVDDNADMRDYVQRLLSRDYEVEAVSDSLAALDAVQRYLPDLVLTDVMMSRLDGLGLLRSLRNNPATQNIPIILLSARAGEESRIEGLEAGADDYLIKPFCARELLARVRSNLELARLRREAVHYQEQLRVEAQAAHKQISNILESITDAFVAFDREWRYTYVNEYATRLLRKKREELLGKHIWAEVFPELVGTQSHWEFHRAVAEQVPIVFEKFSQPMGVWVEVNAYPAPDGLAVYFRDITHRKQAEQALRESEERFRQLTENIGTVFYMSEGFSETSPGRIVYVSPAYERIWGRSCEMLYQNTRSWFEAVHPDDRERIGQALPGITRAEFDVEFRIVRPDGEIRWVHDRVFPVYNERGEVYRTAGIVEDITERKQAEIALRQSEEQARLAIKVGRLGTWRYNLHTDLVELDKRMREIWGEPDDAGTIPLPKVIERIHPDDREWVAIAIGAALDPGSSGTYEIDYRIVWDDGTQRWVSANGQVQFEGEGESRQPIGFFGTALDITDQKRAEDEWRRSEQRLQLAQQAGRIGTWEWNLLTNDVSWSDGIWPLLGIERGSITPSLESFVKFLHPDEQELILQRVEIALAQGDDYNDEFRVFRQDGTICWLLSKGQVIRTQEGHPERLLGINVDITDRKQAEVALRESESRFRNIADHSPIMIWMSAPDGAGVWFNQQWCEFTGQTLDEALGSGWLAVVHPEDAQSIEATCLQAHQRHEPVCLEYRLRRQDGEYRWVFDSAVARFDDTGVYLGYIGSIIDITDRKRTEEALRQSEERYRLALQAARMMTWSWDVKTDIIVRSQTACDVLGLRREGLQEKGSQGWRLVHPDDLAQHQATVQAAIGSKASYISEFRVIRPDNGRVIWIEERGKVNVDATGHLISIEGTLFDISDRKQAQQELQQTLQTLSTLINASPLPIVLIKPNMTVQLWNPAAEQLFGWSEAEVLGQPIPIVPEEKRDEYRQVREAVAKGEVFVGVETYRCKRDGTRVIVSVSAAPLYNEQGSLNSIVLIFQDITQRQRAEEALRQSEERLRLALLVSKAGIWDWDIPHNRVTWSEQIYKFHGLAPGTFGGRVEDFAQLIHPDDQARVSEAIRQALEEKVSYELEFRVVQPSGAVRWLSTSGGAIFDAQGHPIRMLGATRDITERKAVEEEREQLLISEQRAREEAERANRIKDEFLAVLSHELRSPLNPILGWAKLLQSRTLDEQKTKHALATIERNALLQAQLIEDLLDVSRILRGKLVLNAVPVNLASTIEAALETVRLAAQAKGIPIQRVLDPNVGEVMGESARLQQVIWNLLSNAVKFTPSGGTIEIRLEQINNYAQLEVRDTGIGITPEFLPHVFEYFRQEDGTTTRKFGGLGLGLAIVRHLVELHGGTVWAESPGEGLGATFTVRLPLMSTQPTVNQAVQSSEQSLNLNGVQVLVLDDETDTRDFVVFLLEQAGASVIAAASANEAFTALTRSQPDVLISDIGMPETDGYMLMRQIRALPPEQGGKIPAIALTAYAGEFDQQQALSVGFQKHVPKPVEPETLLRAIASLVNPS